MAHTYVIQKVSYPPAGGSDPQVVITGTVDGTQVTATCWLSTYTANAASALSAQNFVIAQLLAAWTLLQPTTPPNAPVAGFTVTQ